MSALDHDVASQGASARENAPPAPSVQDLQKHIDCQERFIGKVSHELRNALTTMKATTQLLNKRGEQEHDETLLRLCQRMDRHLTQATNLISDLLDRTQILQDTFELRKKPVRLDALVAEAIDDFQTTTQTHRLLFACQDRVCVYADEARIGQVLINLLTNAVKYSPLANQVRVSVAKEQAQAIVQVQDFGIGIAADHIEHVFEQFYQVPEALKHAHSGVGMGLYLSCEIVKQHQGQMWIESKPGKGTTFSFCLRLHEGNDGEQCSG